jgi:predicted nucleic acid-binding Zn ribbon protein
VLQKISDAPLTTCLSCGKPAFQKQITAAGFQLKGTGWYATDFRGGNKTSGSSEQPVAPAAKPGESST